MSDTTTTCRCGRPTRDAAYVCDECTGQLNIALGDVPWLEEELETTTTRAKGVDYRTKGGTASSERPSPVVWSAADARGELRAKLVSWVLFCNAEQVRNSSPSQALPDDTLAAMSRWLMWRVDGLALLDIGPEAVDEITEAVIQCQRLIDTPARKQYLGPCDVCPDGRLYSRPGSRWAKCAACEAVTDAEELRTKLLTQLDDRLCTAAEIAHLSTYLGLKANRDQVRQRINQWHARKRITPEASFSNEPTFRFGEIYRMLVESEYASRKTGA